MTNLPDETCLIQKYLAPLAGPEGLGLADDAACLTPRSGMDLVITSDTIVENIHFLPDDEPSAIATKAITANLSDLVAKGASPVSYQVALTLPKKVNEKWFAEFTRGLKDHADGLISGGDMTVSKEGPLTVTVTAIGEVPAGKMVRRKGAQIGDDIYVAGQIGTSALGLKCALDPLSAMAAGLDASQILQLTEHYEGPMVAHATLVQALVLETATACLDVSDGLVIDLERLCTASGVGASVKVQDIPLHESTKRMIAKGEFTIEDAITGGDDYVALFSVNEETAKKHRPRLEACCFRIGKITEANKGVAFLNADGSSLSLGPRKGYDHFNR